MASYAMSRPFAWVKPLFGIPWARLNAMVWVGPCFGGCDIFMAGWRQTPVHVERFLGGMAPSSQAIMATTPLP